MYPTKLFKNVSERNQKILKIKVFTPATGHGEEFGGYILICHAPWKITLRIICEFIA